MYNKKYLDPSKNQFLDRVMSDRLEYLFKFEKRFQQIKILASKKEHIQRTRLAAYDFKWDKSRLVTICSTFVAMVIQIY